MILLLLADESLVEIAHGYDVVHKAGALLCVDELDAPIASFLADEVLAYTLNQNVASRMVDNAASKEETVLQAAPPKRRRLPRGRAAQMQRACRVDEVAG